jgi:hypothetical protein
VGPYAVSCPYFFPDRPLAETSWFRPPRAPLGLLHGGECHAPEGPAPGNHHLCNFGYARGVCGRFPADAPFDAVRFAVIAQESNVTQLLYVLELNHTPAEHGRLTYDANRNRVVGADERALLAAQARAFVTTGLAE